ncbi:hypothetical protein [Actinoallomurus iriomotensis]|uniref:MFS transporter n=1 Tax=Actinoallomurus iriomotensis TaxID=478107 RepID=A0A9W6RJJ0_9ACTN|nr:hypothetical protein [Actinoallomurus iriomotensis]GLY76020.1 hypothetical protein Airi01_042870 [Actinoallomurus iriomotensis]
MTSTSASARLDNRTTGLDRAAFALLATIQVTVIASITVITVALPAIQRDLRTGPRDLVLAASAYGSSFGGLLLLGGRPTDLLRPRAVFVPAPALAAAGVLAGRLLPRLGAPYAGLLVFPLGAGVTFAAATVAATEDVPAGHLGLAGGAPWRSSRRSGSPSWSRSRTPTRARPEAGTRSRRGSPRPPSPSPHPWRRFGAGLDEQERRT